MFRYLAVLSLFFGITLASMCPEGPWIHHEGKCFYEVNTDGNLFDNTDLCNSLGATMVTINSEAENLFLSSNVTKANKCYWIGLQELAYDTQKYTWVDHSHFSFAMWDPLVAQRIPDPCSGFAMYLGLWSARRCSAICGLMCQVYAKDAKRPGTKSNKAIDRIGEAQLRMSTTQLEASKSITEVQNEVQQHRGSIEKLKDVLNGHSTTKNEEAIRNLEDLTSGLSILCIVFLIVLVILIISVIILCIQVRRLSRTGTYYSNK